MREPLLIPSKNVLPFSLGIPATSIKELTSVDLDKVAFLVIDCTDWQLGYQQLQHIRGQNTPDVYLKPVLFYGTSENIPREILQAPDGFMNVTETAHGSAFEAWAAKFEPINTKISTLKDISSEGDSNFAFKVLRFMATRNSEFKPVPSARDTSGYIYPRLQLLFPKQDIGVLETLEYLESRKLVEGTFLNRSYACTHCGCAFLNFFEVCPDCRASDIYNEELLHHFRCAYVGELSDYRQGDELVCPKCDKRLKHIGVDYDKSSVVYHCRSCRNTFQEPQVTTSCYDCWRETEPENQLIREIKTYSITSLGHNGAQYGIESLLQTILASKVHTISFDVFREFFRLELARIERYRVSTSCLAILRLDGVEKIYGLLGKRAHEIFVELSEAFRKGLRNSDVFTVRDETVFLALLTETSRENAELALTRLKERITSLLESNLNMSFQVDSKVYPLSPGLSLENSIEKFLQSHAA